MYIFMCLNETKSFSNRPKWFMGICSKDKNLKPLDHFLTQILWIFESVWPIDTSHTCHQLLKIQEEVLSLFLFGYDRLNVVILHFKSKFKSFVQLQKKNYRLIFNSFIFLYVVYCYLEIYSVNGWSILKNRCFVRKIVVLPHRMRKVFRGL